MPMTVDEAIHALIEMKSEIGLGRGGSAILVTADDSGYLRDMEVGWPVQPTDPDEPPEEAVILMHMGDFASDAEEAYERRMDRY